MSEYDGITASEAPASGRKLCTAGMFEKEIVDELDVSNMSELDPRSGSSGVKLLKKVQSRGIELSVRGKNWISTGLGQSANLLQLDLWKLKRKDNGSGIYGLDKEYYLGCLDMLWLRPLLW
ncbi:hypothetical protein U9M48_031630 [Paspalum notatum var. saurae]|uniref:Uncharacterized protein n=1 Tax=Paspalum notatum var. saurae TaxID=547442 RepID=A0AAQ3X3X9_PASNO